MTETEPTGRTKRRVITMPDDEWQAVMDLAWRNRISASEQVRQICRAAVEADARKRARAAEKGASK